MEIPRKNLCPLRDMQPCAGLDCMWFTHLQGVDPQNRDKIIDTWDCAIVWQVKGLLTVAKHTGEGLAGVQAATESFRNEMVNANGIGAIVQRIASTPALPAAEPPRLVGSNKLTEQPQSDPKPPARKSPRATPRRKAP
jgi:hypothetical protein